VRVACIPVAPPEALRAHADVSLRFEDVTQDGRLVLDAIPNALGPAVWRAILSRDPSVMALLKEGIVPVLSRFMLEGEPGPVSATAVVEARGACQFARAADGRIVVDMWADLYAPLGRTYGAARTGEAAARREPDNPALVGRVFAEHVLTRPFAPAGERRVRDLSFPGAPAVMASRLSLPAPETIAVVPEGATALEPGMRIDPMPITFGIVHTDSNVHVNSLVYVRLFEEAALRRFLALGRGTTVLGRTLEIVYRKPCFAGQTVRVIQRAFEESGRLGVAAVLVEEGGAATEEALTASRPHAYARMHFS
jgi:hypothetical protein